MEGKMKRIILLSVIFVVCLAFVSCGSGQRRKNASRNSGGYEWSEKAPEKKNWDMAKDYCETLEEEGSWKLPTLSELATIYQENHQSAFGDTDDFWTSEEINENRAYGFDFSFGRKNPSSKESEFSVRCVKINE